MDIQVLARKSASKMLVETCLQVFRNELKLQNSRYSLIVVPKRRMSVEEGVRGSVFKIAPTIIGMSIDTALDIERLIIALAHEMVHVKQYARGQITHGKNLNSRFWMGKKFKGHYYDLPWEVEAFSKERVLANKVFQIIDKADTQLKSKKNGKK